jgi:hypothetical protein
MEKKPIKIIVIFKLIPGHVPIAIFPKDLLPCLPIERFKISMVLPYKLFWGESYKR